MKETFKTTWKSSVQARKQRKYRTNAPLHTRSAFLHAPLSKELRDKQKRKHMRVRTGDEVQVMRGQFKGVKGVVERVNTKDAKVVVRGVDMVKLDGGRRPYPVNASNVRIIKLTEDRRRAKR